MRAPARLRYEPADGLSLFTTGSIPRASTSSAACAAAPFAIRTPRAPTAIRQKNALAKAPILPTAHGGEPRSGKGRAIGFTHLRRRRIADARKALACG